MFNCYYYCYKRGIKIGKKTYSDEELIAELHRFVEENDRVPGRRDFNTKNGYPSWNTYVKRFGSWDNGILAAKLIPNRRYDYTDEFLKDEIYRFIDENGKIPERRDFTVKNGYPSCVNYVTRFGGWDKCLSELGVKIVEYTEDILIKDLQRFYNENNRIPFKYEMCSKNGYAPFKQYLKIFSDWENALYKSGLTKYDYSDESLLKVLKDFYNIHGRSPSITDLNNDPTNPAVSVYYRKFQSWNNSLKFAGLPVNMTHEALDGTETCSVCGNSKCNTWSIVDGNRVCQRCIHNRLYYHGIQDPNSTVGFGILMETVVSMTLNDCIKCNTPDSFNSPFDLISKKLGTINVKSSKLHHRSTRSSDCWLCAIKSTTPIPDYFIAVGLNETRDTILHVWIIPGINDVQNKSGFCFVNSEIGLHRIKKYEVDAEPYNKMYQELDIYTLPEFCNLNKTDEVLA
ncbi:MAG: hypothetical protein M0P99_07660 [Candidatus Cloacimonetes bacterium]|nr:hypothetical protein [Candidatus Cloacimonadota bacterium]